MTIRARRLLFRLLLVIVAIPVVFYIGYIITGFAVLIGLCAARAPIARARGWGSEGRLIRYLSRPRLADESRRSHP